MTNEEFLNLRNNTIIFDTTEHGVFKVISSELNENGKIIAKMNPLGEDKEEVIEIESVEKYAMLSELKEGMNPYVYAAFMVSTDQIESNVSGIIHCMKLCQKKPQRNKRSRKK